MADIIDIKGGKRPKKKKHEKETPSGILIACHCKKEYFELRNGGLVHCIRCGCRQPIEWTWKT